jgi:1-acyl-sn-glycerol-3-phosphate acyltransferase
MAKATLFQKDLPEEERIFYYESTEDDPIQTKEQEQTHNKVELEDGYVFIKRNPFVIIYEKVLYFGFKLFARWYAKFYLHMTIKNRQALKKAKGSGYVIYANHTNPFHDAFSPALVADRHIYTICSPANLHIPGIGKFLPALGALPLGKNPEQKAAFNKAVDTRLKQKKCLVIYPEAHVWPYYTGIRKFPAGDRSFKYPARNLLPIFTMTTTYQKSRKKGQARPDMTVYLDGPFYPDPKKTEDENRAILAEKAYESMLKYSKRSNYEYFQYRKKTN